MASSTASAVPNSGSHAGRASTTIASASPSAPSFSRVLGAFTYSKNRQMSPVKVGATAVTDNVVVLIGSLRGPGLTTSDDYSCARRRAAVDSSAYTDGSPVHPLSVL